MIASEICHPRYITQEREYILKNSLPTIDRLVSSGWLTIFNLVNPSGGEMSFRYLMIRMPDGWDDDQFPPAPKKLKVIQESSDDSNLGS